jgi:hypothetical protein
LSICPSARRRAPGCDGIGKFGEEDGHRGGVESVSTSATPVSRWGHTAPMIQAERWPRSRRRAACRAANRHSWCALSGRPKPPPGSRSRSALLECAAAISFRRAANPFLGKPFPLIDGSVRHSAPGCVTRSCYLGLEPAGSPAVSRTYVRAGPPFLAKTQQSSRLSADDLRSSPLRLFAHIQPPAVGILPGHPFANFLSTMAAENA